MADTAARSASGPRPAAVLDHHAEATGGADAADRRRRYDQNEAFLDYGQLLQEGSLERGTRFLRILRALLEWLEGDEDGTRVGSVGEGGAREADQVDRVADPGHLKGQFRDPPIDFIGSCERSAPRQLRYDDEVALIDLRDEADRRFTELVETEEDHAGIHDHHQHGEAHDPRRQPAVAAPERVKAEIEAAKETMDRARPPPVALMTGVRLQEQGAHRGRQRQ